MSELSELIAARGVKLDLHEGDLVSEIVVIAEIIGENGPTIGLGSSENISWIKQAGMVHIANQICSQQFMPAKEDDE